MRSTRGAGSVAAMRWKFRRLSVQSAPLDAAAPGFDRVRPTSAFPPSGAELPTAIPSQRAPGADAARMTRRPPPRSTRNRTSPELTQTEHVAWPRRAGCAGDARILGGGRLHSRCGAIAARAPTDTEIYLSRTCESIRCAGAVLQRSGGARLTSKHPRIGEQPHMLQHEDVCYQTPVDRPWCSNPS